MNAQGTIARAAGRAASGSSQSLLRLALKLDAVVTGANGAAYLALAGVLDGPLGLPAGVLRPAGAFLLVFAALVWHLATRPAIPARAAGAVVAANALWVLDSLAVAAFGWLSPSAAGTAWIVLQALVVAGFAALQYAGLRRS